MDYRGFLGQVETVVLPFFGGAHVDLPSRRLRVAPPPPAPGWWTFDVRGRTATARAPAGAPGLEGLPLVRGHLWGTRLVRAGAVAEPLWLPPDEVPERFSPVRARRWHDGTLLLEAAEFEAEAEARVRECWDTQSPLARVKAVPATLRAAFGYAVLEARARALGIRFAPVEVRAHVLAVAEQGADVADTRLRALALARSAPRAASRVGTPDETPDPLLRATGDERVERALERAGARLLALRQRPGALWEVTFGFMGERFQSLVRMDTLGVVDAGLCLAGEDRRVTLESLPSVIREAIAEDVLVITRHV